MKRLGSGRALLPCACVACWRTPFRRHHSLSWAMDRDSAYVAEADDTGAVRMLYRIRECPCAYECTKQAWDRVNPKSYSKEALIKKTANHLKNSGHHLEQKLDMETCLAMAEQMPMEEAEETEEHRREYREHMEVHWAKKEQKELEAEEAKHWEQEQLDEAVIGGGTPSEDSVKGGAFGRGRSASSGTHLGSKSCKGSGKGKLSQKGKPIGFGPGPAPVRRRLDDGALETVVPIGFGPGPAPVRRRVDDGALEIPAEDRQALAHAHSGASLFAQKMKVMSEALNRAQLSARQAQKLSLQAASKAAELSSAFQAMATQYNDEIGVMQDAHRTFIETLSSL